MCFSLDTKYADSQEVYIIGPTRSGRAMPPFRRNKATHAITIRLLFSLVVPFANSRSRTESNFIRLLAVREQKEVKSKNSKPNGELNVKSFLLFT